MAGTDTIRDPARRAEAERYLRTSRARLQFWCSCWLFFPLANGLALALLAWSQSAVWGVLALLPVVEAAILYRLVRVFAPDRRAAWWGGGVALAALVSFAACLAVGFIWFLTHYRD